MYEWLEREIAEIKTRKFHLVDGPADAKLRRAIKSSKLAAPRSFKEFALEFGNAQLYRQDLTGLYWVTVYASMHAKSTAKGEPLFEIGMNQIHYAYFKQELLSGEKESPVFEWIVPAGYLRKAADGFEEWLSNRCKNARKKYSQRRWQEILQGPRPFTERELKIVDARKHIQWRITGITKNGNVKFEVHNGASIALPYLFVGVRDKGGLLKNCGVHLPINDIRPGDTEVVEVDCYKDLVPPEEIEAYPVIDVGPEDREFHWEFRQENSKNLLA